MHHNRHSAEKHIFGTHHRSDIFMGWHANNPLLSYNKVRAASDHGMFSDFEMVLSVVHRTNSLS